MKRSTNKLQNNWTTWWTRAQRGLGLFQKSCSKHHKIRLKEIPVSSKMALRFSAYYDQEDVILEDILIHDEANTILICPLCMIKRQDDVYFKDIDLSNLNQNQLTIEYTIQNQCVSGFEFMDYDEFLEAPAQIYGLSRIDLYTNQLEGCICAFGDSIVEQGHYTRILKEELQHKHIALLNLGISGNRLLRKIESVDLTKTENQEVLKSLPLSKTIIQSISLSNQVFGLSGISRFEKDVLSCRNVEKIIIAIGVNDLYQPGTFCAREDELPSLNEMKEGYEILEKKSESPCLFCAITSFLGNPHYTFEKEKLRKQVNEHLLHRKYAIEFDRVLDHRASLFNEDMLHPNQEGGKRIAKEIISWLFS